MLEANFFASSPHPLAHLFKFIQISEEMSLMDTLHESLATFSLSKLCQCNCRNCGQAAECSEVPMAPGPSRSRPTTCSEIHEIHGKVGMRNMRNECLRYLRSRTKRLLSSDCRQFSCKRPWHRRNWRPGPSLYQRFLLIPQFKS